MPRKGPAVKREIEPDPIYQNPLVTQLINKILLSGKKSVAEHIVYKALEDISERTANDPVITLKRAVENARPLLEVRSRRVGGATYQVPVEIRPERRLALARRWIVRFARQRGGKSMSEKLAFELLDASQNTGGAVKRKEETHRMAESNKAFSHFRY